MAAMTELNSTQLNQVITDAGAKQPLVRINVLSNISY